MEWENPSQALEVLAACNHYVIRDAGTVNSLPDLNLKLLSRPDSYAVSALLEISVVFTVNQKHIT